jgi:hypothetical protein
MHSYKAFSYNSINIKLIYYRIHYGDSDNPLIIVDIGKELKVMVPPL